MKSGALRDLIIRYDKQPSVRALIRFALTGANFLVPGAGSVADIALDATVRKIAGNRGREFFDELAEGDFVSRELLENEDFVHCFAATLSRALNTHRQEKTRMFARLLKTPLSDTGTISDVDEYEYFLDILNDLNYREFQALRILDSFNRQRPKDQPIDLQWTMTIWEDFEQELTHQLGIPASATGEFMHRLSRTACYLEFSGTAWDYEGGMGKVTPTYRRLLECIQKNETDGNDKSSM